MRNLRSLVAAATLIILGQAMAAGTLIGAFDVGPGGSPVPSGPWYNTAGNTWISKIWTPLVSLNADASGLEPQLALGWSSNDDFTQWTFELRNDVVWHDGHAFDADDVKFTWEWVFAPGSTAGPEIPPAKLAGQDAYSAGEADHIAGLEVRGPTTVRFTTAEPSPRFPNTLIQAYILPQHALAEVSPSQIRTTDWWFTRPVGTGPFKHDAFVADESWALVPHEGYWRGAPRLERLINRYFADETSAILALESGAIQFSYASGDVAVGLGQQARFELHDGPSGVTNYLMFNMREPIFQDVRVRQAFLHAIDRETIAEVVLNGTATVVPCITPFSAFWPESYQSYAYDPALARQLLAEAGWDASRRFEVKTYYDSQFHADAMAAMQQFLSEAGIQVEFIVDVAGYNSYFYTGTNWDISYRGLGVNTQAFPYHFYEPGGWPEVADEPYTLMGMRQPELEAIFAQARGEGDAAVYNDLLTQACAVQNEEALEGYLWTAVRFGVASAQVQDFYWYPAPAGGPYEDRAELWTIGN